LYDGQTVSVILPTYNERDSIRAVILGFFATGVVDEIVVVNNNAAAGTSDEVAGTGAREIHEPQQGYGAAIQRGFLEATGDLMVVCEPDGTFEPRDIFKLLAYSPDLDVVYGSRTVGVFIWSGANMGFFLRFGNWFVGKLVEVLFNTNSLSDVGCTYRLIRREAVEVLRPHYRINGSEFGPEMMCLSIIAGMRLIQVPVNYRARVGVSSVTGSRVKAIRLGLRMIVLILSHWLRRRTTRRAIASTRPDSPS
jgi:glycosyltransferase involved in cell wall biosynthesis